MFTYRPHDLSAVQAAVTSPEMSQSQADLTEGIETRTEQSSEEQDTRISSDASSEMTEKTPGSQIRQQGGGKKRRRHRH
jgi:hypothetical protein